MRQSERALRFSSSPRTPPSPQDVGIRRHFNKPSYSYPPPLSPRPRPTPRPSTAASSPLICPRTPPQEQEQGTLSTSTSALFLLRSQSQEPLSQEEQRLQQEELITSPCIPTFVTSPPPPPPPPPMPSTATAAAAEARSLGSPKQSSPKTTLPKTTSPTRSKCLALHISPTQKMKTNIVTNWNSGDDSLTVRERALATFTLISESICNFPGLDAVSNGKSIACTCVHEPGIDSLDAACGAGSGCSNRAMCIECNPLRCPCGSFCQNRRLQLASYPSVEIFECEHKGFGLRALEDIPPDTLVLEYIGEIIPKDEVFERVKRYKDHGIVHQYFMQFSASAYCDATKYGSFARFINHSCNPNCKTTKWTVKSKTRVGIFSAPDAPPIKKGAEITFDYRFRNFAAEPVICYCNEPNCRGVIGDPNPSQPARKQKTRSDEESEDVEEKEEEDQEIEVDSESESEEDEDDDDVELGANCTDNLNENKSDNKEDEKDSYESKFLQRKRLLRSLKTSGSARFREKPKRIKRADRKTTSQHCFTLKKIDGVAKNLETASSEAEVLSLISRLVKSDTCVLASFLQTGGLAITKTLLFRTLRNATSTFKPPEKKRKTLITETDDEEDDEEEEDNEEKELMPFRRLRRCREVSGTTEKKLNGDLLVKVLQLLLVLPVTSKNTLMDVEKVITEKLCESHGDPTVRSLAQQVVKKWQGLQVIYRIPRIQRDNNSTATIATTCTNTTCSSASAFAIATSSNVVSCSSPRKQEIVETRSVSSSFSDKDADENEPSRLNDKKSSYQNGYNNGNSYLSNGHKMHNGNSYQRNHYQQNGDFAEKSYYRHRDSSKEREYHRHSSRENGYHRSNGDSFDRGYQLHKDRSSEQSAQPLQYASPPPAAAAVVVQSREKVEDFKNMVLDRIRAQQEADRERERLAKEVHVNGKFSNGNSHHHHHHHQQNGGRSRSLSSNGYPKKNSENDLAAMPRAVLDFVYSVMNKHAARFEFPRDEFKNYVRTLAERIVMRDPKLAKEAKHSVPERDQHKIKEFVLKSFKQHAKKLTQVQRQQP